MSLQAWHRRFGGHEPKALTPSLYPQTLDRLQCSTAIAGPVLTLEASKTTATVVRETALTMRSNVVAPRCKGSTELRRLLGTGGRDAFYDNTTCVKWGGPEHEDEHPGVRCMKENDDVLLDTEQEGAVRVLLEHRRLTRTGTGAGAASPPGSQYLSCGHLDAGVAAVLAPLLSAGSGYMLAYARLGQSRRSYDGRVIRIVVVKQ